MPILEEKVKDDSLGNGTSVLNEIIIKGFWGEKTVSFKVRRDVNFLIGSNGSGKTTVINLVAAALQVEVTTLGKNTFSSLTLKFSAARKKRVSTIVVVSKSTSPDSPEPVIEYAISSPPLPVKHFRVSTDRGTNWLVHRVAREGSMIVTNARLLRAMLRDICSVTWLSIQRTHSGRIASAEQDFDTPIDRKLNYLGNELVRYFSLLATRSDAQMAKFQKSVFLSLVSQETQSNAIALIKKLDLPGERQALEDIFKDFHLDDADVGKLVANHFAAVEGTLRKRPRQGLDWGDVYASVAMLRVHALAEAWGSITEARQKIDQPKTEFLSILNALTNKIFSINAKKELRVKLKAGGANITLKDLSSGEKQLLIILGEALLQERNACIFLADEPELSLHIEWQSKLIGALRTVSPNAQILFATHSPDIVGVHQDRVIDMQDILL
jgi:predicted ATPase